MGKRIRITFVEEAISVEAELLEDQAPRTCRTIWEILPTRAQARHSMLSGQEIFAILETRPELKLPKENATNYVLPGDVAYNFIPGGRYHGFPDDVCEINWYYGRYARPQLPDGPNAVNIFARILGDPSDFYDASQRIRTEGPKAIAFSWVEEEE